MICDRCSASSPGGIGSYFNREILCWPCRDLEEHHPAWEAARRRENEAVAQGDYNFPGVGLPDGYEAWAASFPPTEREVERARSRLAPYINGYPEPMIDARRLRIANGTASLHDRRQIAAEDVVVREVKAARG